MKKYIDAEKLKKLVGELKEQAERNRCDSWGIVPDALEEVEGFITTLQQEQIDVDIEKEIEEHAIHMPHGEFTSDNEVIEDMEWAREEFRHFYERGLDAGKKK